MRKNILIFGATGDTGVYFVDYCLSNLNQNEYRIIAVGTRKTNFFETINVEYYQVDISDKLQFDVLPKNIYAVVDLAGIMPARMKGYDPFKYIYINTIGTLNILEFCRVNSVDRILFAQSFGDIKDHALEKPILTADLPRKFSYTTDHTVYVISKNAAVDLIESYHQMYGIKRFIFRLPTIYLYSPNENYFVDGIEKEIAYRTIINQAIAGEKIEVWGDANKVKDMVYVKDFCQMLMKALIVDRESGFYNVGTGTGTSLRAQIEGIVKVFSPEAKQSEIIYSPEKPSAPEYIMDSTPAQNELGYVPQYNYLDFLIDFKKEMEENRFKELYENV